VLALFVTVSYFLVMFGFSRLSSRIIHAEECERLVQYVADDTSSRIFSFVASSALNG
jgi:hypothetical protein